MLWEFSMKRIVIISLILFFIISYIDAKEKIPKEHIVKVLITDHTEHIGTLLAINDTLLVIWSCLDPFNENEAEKFSQVFHYSNIKWITLVRKSSFASGAKKGLLITALIGTLYTIKRVGDGYDEPLKKPITYFVIPLSWVCIPGTLIGGIVGTVCSFNQRYKIFGNEARYYKTTKKLKKMAFFKENFPDNLQQIIDSSLP